MAANPYGYRLAPNGILGPNGDAHPLVTGSSPLLMSTPGSQTVPFASGWSSAGVTLGSLEGHLESGVAFSSKSAETQALLTAMNRQTTHFGQTIYYRRMIYAAGREGSYMGPYHQIRTNFVAGCTSAAFVKLLSGNIPSAHWLTGYNTSQGGWQLVGTYYAGGTTGYTHNHPHGAGGSSACEFLIALPGTVFGYVDLSNTRNWWIFPNVDGGMG